MIMQHILLLGGKNMKPITMLKKGHALLLVEVQRDFCSGGALPVPGGDEIIPVLNEWIAAVREAGVPLYASRDWHPLRHVSFQGEGGEWPPHCLQDTQGAEFHPGLQLPEALVKISKGVRFDKDQYSAFDETGFDTLLRRDGIKRLWIGGLAQDICVMATALSARKAGFQAGLILNATRPLTPEGGKQSLAEMKNAGVEILHG